MREFFLGQMDYIFFLYGLAFILLFSVCSSLQKQQKTQIPWNFLGLFGLVHGINEWLDMLALSFGDSGPFKWVRLAIMAASFVGLLEFGRLTCERLKNIRIGRWIYIPIFLAIISEAPAGMPGLNAAVRYALGLTGGLWAAFAMWLISRKSQRGAWAAVIAAVAMAGYAVAAGFVVPQAGLLSAATVNQDSFLKIAGFPVQLLRGFAACVIAFLIWYYHEEFREEKMDSRRTLYEKSLAAGAVLLLFLILALGWFWINRVGQSEAVAQRMQLINVSQQVVMLVDPEQVKSLDGSAADLENPAYELVKNRLQNLRNTISFVHSLYLMRKVEGKIILLADSEPSGSKEESPPGQAYEEATPKLKGVFVSGKGAVEGPVTDRRGTWVSTFAPLNDNQTGKMIAVLGIDQSGSGFSFALAHARFQIILSVGLTCLFAIFIFVYGRRFSETFKQTQKGKKKDDEMLHRWLVALVVLLGAILTSVLFFESRHSAWDSFQTIFTQRAIIRAQNVSQEVERQLDRMDGLRRFLDSRETVERDEFKQYVTPLLKGVPIRAFEWIPRVTREERLFYESSAKQDGIEGFQIFERDSQGRKTPAANREEYFPVFYVEPLAGNENAEGFDLASDPVRRSAMEKSRDTGRTVATTPLVLVQEGQKKTGVLIFMPVYLKDLPQHTVAQRRKSLRGFVLAVYSADEFLKGIYSKMQPEGLACLIEDLDAPADGRVLYRHAVRDGIVDWNRPLRKYEMPLDMPAREWRVTIVPSTTFIEKYLSRAYWWILLLGFFLTTLVAAFLNFLATARYRAEDLVKLRTEELLKEKEELRKSREDVQLILNSVGEAIYGIDLEGRCTFCNRACLQILGYADFSELIGKNMHNQIHHTCANGKGFPAEQCRIFQAFQKGEGTHVDDEVLWKADGNSFLAEYWSFPQWQEGSVIGAVVTFVDITERKAAEQAIRESEERFRQITNSSEELIWETDPKGLYTYASAVMEKMYGFTPEEVIGKKYFYDFFPPENKEKLIQEIFEGFSKKLIFRDFSNAIVHRNGKVVFLATNAMPILDGRGELLGYRGLDRDITAAKAAEDTLREREAYLSSILDNFPYMVWLKDVDGRFLAVNKIFAQACGRASVADVVGKNDFDVWPRALAEQYRADDNSVIQSRAKTIVEEPIVDHGVTGYFETYKSPIFDAEGHVIGTVGFAHDVTERKKSQDALRVSEERFKKIASSITDYIYTVHIENGKITETVHGPGCIGVTGYSAEELKSQSMLWINMVPEEDKSKLLGQVRQALSGTEPSPIEHRIICKDGSLRWVSSRIILRFGERGQLIAYEGVIADITDRKQAELRLQQAFDAMQTLLEQMPFGVVVVGNDKTIHQINSAALKMMGAVSANDILRKKCHGCICTAQEGQCPVLDLGQAVDRAENELIKCDGSRIPILKTVLPITLAGEEVLLETFVDITELKRAEEALVEARRQAETANKTKSQFLANMSHEIRTPMNAVIGFSELLENTALNRTQKDYVGTIRESGQMLMLLIHDILDVSKIEAGELKLEEIDFDLIYLLRSVIKMNSTRLEKKPVEMFCNTDENMPKSYKGDPTRIRQILTNLISNAIKFTEKGEISISVKAQEGISGSSVKRRMLEFSVKDTGIGIPQDKHEKIFEAFEQADTSTTRRYGGTGLGLTISKTLVAMMGGKIWVQSTLGQGSEFFFTLNLEEAVPIVEKDIMPLRIMDLEGKKVLIVDDNESASKMLDIYCREAGMDVLHKAASAKEALDWLLLQTELPEIILSDIMMPGMDGYELARAIKKHAKTQAIKLVAVTSDVKSGAAKIAEKAGFDAFLPKPVFKNDLIEVMRAVLGDKRQDSGADQIVTRHMAGELACKGLKILVAEDNLVNQKLLQVVLGNLGCEVDVASNGQVAVEKVKTHSYDLVLMDIQMPGMGGYEATAIIRSQISKTLPILALTAAVLKEDEQKSLASGMNDFITKPVELTRLREKILEWAGRPTA